MTLSTSHILLKDDLSIHSSTDLVAALAKSSWKQDTSELTEGSSSSSTRKSNRSVSHAVLVDDGKGRSRTAALKRGGRSDPSSFLAISSSSSSSSSDEDDDDDDGYYSAVNSSSPQSQVASRNLRTQNSGTPSSSISTSPPDNKSPPARFPAVSRKNGSRFSESEDDDDDDDDDEEEEEDKDDDDDDVPLAQRIPGALTVQKSIRRQVRQEREKKKREKALRDHAETSRTRLMTLRPGASPSSSHDVAAALVASQTTTDRNSRTSTKNGSRSLNPDDSARKRSINGSDGVEAATTSVDAAALYQRLHSLHRSKSMTRSLRDIRPPSTELPPVPFPQSLPLSSHTQQSKNVKDPSSLPYHYHTSPSPTPINSTYAPSSIARLRPMRSFHFHRPSIDNRPIGMDDPRYVPLPLDAEKRISQNSSSRSRPSTRDGPKQQTSTFPTAIPTQQHHRSPSRSRNTVERTLANTNPQPVPPIPTTQSISHGEHRKLFQIFIIYDSSLFFFLRAGSSRISADADKHLRAPLRQHRSAPSVSSPADSLPMVSSKPELVVQQRVFIGNMQRFNMVEIGASTTAGDIIEMIEAEGTFKEYSGNGGWMVFEVAQDFGMGTLFFFSLSLSFTSSLCQKFVSTFFFFLSFLERPIRSFELVADVQSSWNKDKMVNYLVLRMTPLEVPLNRSVCCPFVLLFSFFYLLTLSLEGHPI
jgi:hypothetical protein